MIIRSFKIVVAIFLSFLFTISLCKIVLVVHNFFTETRGNFATSERVYINDWLDDNGLGDYKELFREKGK
jgi:hypothetical protein